MGKQILPKYMITFFTTIFLLLLTMSILPTRPSLANPEIDEIVTLSNPQIHGKITEKGINATINFQSDRSLENERLRMDVSFPYEYQIIYEVRERWEKESGVMTLHYHYPFSPYTGKSSKTELLHGFPGNLTGNLGEFTMSGVTKGEFRFRIYNPPYTVSGGGARTTIRLKGKQTVDITLNRCIDDKCEKMNRISNALKVDVEFE